MDKNTFDNTHKLWGAARRCGAGRLAVYAMVLLGQMSNPTPENQPAGRLVLLAMFQMADIESWSKDGYHGTVAADLVPWTGLAEREIGGQLALLHIAGLVQRHRDPVANEWRYHPPQYAVDWINGES